MKFMEERILKDGQVCPGEILKVDSFLNHQLDLPFLDEIGKTFYERYKDAGITKIVTVETSGIAIACMTALRFGVPVVFAKKSRKRDPSDDLYVSTAHSYTHKRNFNITLSREYLTAKDKVLLVDDFMARGEAMRALISICHTAGAEIAGIGIAIEKGFQGGGDALRSQGYEVTSCAVIDRMDDRSVVFRPGT